MAGVVTYTMTVDGETWKGGIAYTESTRQEIIVANGAADTAISFGGVTTVSVLVIKSDQALTINLNLAAGTDITVAADRPQVFLGGGITALFVSNASGSNANVIINMYGA